MYGKLFASMFRGSLYGKWQAIITFQQMIILADQDGTVDFTIEALNATTSIPLDILREGIAVLQAPDRTSRTPGEDGRRIVLVDENRPWGWLIVNYAKYRAIRTAEDRREYHRQYWHQRKTQPDSTGTQQNQPIVEAKAEAKAEAKTTTSLPLGLSLDTWMDFKENRKALKAKLTPRAELMIIAKLEKLRLEGHAPEEVVKTSIENGWKGVFPLRGNGHEAPQRIDNSAPARVRRANAKHFGRVIEPE